MDDEFGVTRAEVGRHSFAEPLDTAPKADVSPLEQIRYTELLAARRIAAARESARVLIETTQHQVDDLLREAEQAGRLEGQAHYADATAKAMDAAGAVLSQAQQQVKQLRGQAEHNMDNLVSTMLEFAAGEREDIP